MVNLALARPAQAFVNHMLQGFVHALLGREETGLRRASSIGKLLRPALIAGGAMAFSGVCGASAQDIPAADDAQPFDWSVGLRGQYTLDSGGGHVETVLTPDASIRFFGPRDQTTLRMGATLAYDGAVHPDELRIGADSSYEFDPLTRGTTNVDLTLNQLRANDTSLPANTAIGPLEFTGTAATSVTRKFGLFDLTGRLNGERFMEGPLTLDDASVVDNAYQSYWLGGGGLRLAYEFTPLISVFIDGSEIYRKYDAPSPSLLAPLDGRTTELRGGVSYTQEGILSAEASLGRAWLDYDAAGLNDAPTWVYDASLSFNPDETLNVGGSFQTTLGPSDTVAGDTDVDYVLTGNARYTVNPWLTLRSSASWDRTITLGSGDDTTTYSVGAGLDFATSKHVAWTADYLFKRTGTPPSPVSDSHTVSVGVRVKR